MIQQYNTRTHLTFFPINHSGVPNSGLVGLASNADIFSKKVEGEKSALKSFKDQMISKVSLLKITLYFI